MRNARIVFCAALGLPCKQGRTAGQACCNGHADRQPAQAAPAGLLSLQAQPVRSGGSLYLLEFALLPCTLVAAPLFAQV